MLKELDPKYSWQSTSHEEFRSYSHPDWWQLKAKKNYGTSKLDIGRKTSFPLQ